MYVTKVETVTLDEFPNLVWVRVCTNEGLTGLGEAFVGGRAVTAYLHETVAPYLLGKDPLQIEYHSRQLYGYLGFKSTGVESRGNSAVDIALWDLLGKSAGMPIYQLLGGASRDRIRIYNTCAGYRYVRSKPVQHSDNWGLPENGGSRPYEDLEAFLHRADELAQSLLEQGITAMKIWPFDLYAEASGGSDISTQQLVAGLEPFRKIRHAVGNEIDIMVEFHSLWNLPTAKQLFRALEEFEPYWFEDPIKVDNLSTVAELARSTPVPIVVSETLGSRWAFNDVLQTGAADIIMMDLGWCGGLTEGKKIASMAETHHRPVTLHDCSGPVVLAASVHLSINAPNAILQETVRAFYTDWYHDLVTEIPRIEQGYIFALERPGHGLGLLPDLTRRDDARVHTSSL